MRRLTNLTLVLLFAAAPAAAGELRWTFESSPDRRQIDYPRSSELVGDAALRPTGPTAEMFEGMPERNVALSLDGDGDFVRVPDDGESSPLKFRQGDTLSIEAWVRLDDIGRGQNVYLVGKGRTYEEDRKENQNYAIRLREIGGEARLSFLFRSRPGEAGKAEHHRWTSNQGFVAAPMWHQVAVSYVFGEPNSLRAYLDGKPVKGKWDLGGATKRAPVVDDDDLWIGSSMGGKSGSSLRGALDNVAIHRRALSDQEIAARWTPIVRPPRPPESGLPQDSVLITLTENAGDHAAWSPAAPHDADITYEHTAFGIDRIPAPYDTGGVRRDWSGPVLLRAMAKIDLPDEPMEWMLRAGGLSRLWVGDKIIAETPPHLKAVNAHNDVQPYDSDDPWLRPPHPGHRETIVTHTASDGPTLVTLETIIGGKNLRYEAGEILVAVRTPSQTQWQVLSQQQLIPLTDRGWKEYADAEDVVVQRVEDQLRRQAASKEDAFWERRHQRAAEYIRSLPPIEVPGIGAHPNPIDRFLAEPLADAGIQPAPLVDDRAFLRRLYLDSVGVPPNNEEIAAFESLSGKPGDRRTTVIETVLSDPRWADHWTSYWLDVLAENPNILKPTLNNTGPFRWYIHDAMRDNVAVDRWVTGLIRMEGSLLAGGPAGFGMAAQNDVPMAAKAHILGTAFLAANMKCARCHDAPYHDWTQQDLFSLAAMLKREPIKIPASSSVPAAFFEEGAGSALINLSVKPGDAVEPAWPLEDYTSNQQLDESLLGRKDSSRERLAAYLTRPENQQFAKVVVNRLWKRLIGEAIVEPVDDWNTSTPSHPELLDYLARELTRSGYDFKHVARLIYNSEVYQREAEDRRVVFVASSRLFASPRRRRMSAEQIVDSMHAVVGRSMQVDELTFDPEARQKPNVHLNLGRPSRAWQLTSLSNERDRPSLTLPTAAAVTECLEAFGWEGARQDPINQRPTEPNVRQPGMLAGGLLSIQLTRLTDQDRLTQECIDAGSARELVDCLFDRFLTREPTQQEAELFVGLLADGFDERLMEPPMEGQTPIRDAAVSWANHLSSEANRIRMRELQRLQMGPEPTARLHPDWRRRAEDAVWALINTPEFQFVP